MTRTLAFLMALGLVAACDGGNPLVTADDTTTTGGTTTGSGSISGSGRTLPPGTTSPTASRAIIRYEDKSEEEGNGGGYATSITYNNDLGQDEFNVDNIPFDGDNSYVRGNTAGAQNNVGQLGAFAVYEADNTTTDPLTGNVIDTFTYRAIYGRSTSGATEFAIVRSGSYAQYGFGGFIYQRNETDDTGADVDLVMPASGDAEYTGDYAGIRIYNGTSGMHYVAGTAEMMIDFKDFNDGQQGVALFIRDRRLFDLDGNDVTPAYITAVETISGLGTVRLSDSTGNTVLPTVGPVVDPSVADDNGELVQGLNSTWVFTDGTTGAEGTGTYYAIMSGSNAEEIVGIAVTTGTNYFAEGTSYQETGGFIIYRQ